MKGSNPLSQPSPSVKGAGWDSAEEVLIMKLYKLLDAKGRPCNGGKGQWFLPKGNRPGKWMPFIENLIPCQSGYHLCRQKDLLGWLNETIWVAEARGGRVLCDNKVVVRQARLVKKLDWNDQTARLFACDCARRVLHIYEKQHPKDSRPRKCIDVAEQFARGNANRSDLAAARAAAWAAARGAAGDAAWAAARAAAWAAARGAAGDAAWAAARGAAGDATRAAAWAAAGNAEYKWQTRRLMQYLQGKRI